MKSLVLRLQAFVEVCFITELLRDSLKVSNFKTKTQFIQLYFFKIFLFKRF